MRTTLASALLLTTAAACSVDTAPIAGSRVPSRQLFADGGAQIVTLVGRAGAAAPAGGSKRDAEVVPTASPDGGMARADEDAGPAAPPDVGAADTGAADAGGDAAMTVGTTKPELGRTCDECMPDRYDAGGVGLTMPCASGYACIAGFSSSSLGGRCFPYAPNLRDNPEGISCYMLLADPTDPNSLFARSGDPTWPGRVCAPPVTCANWATQYPNSPL